MIDRIAITLLAIFALPVILFFVWLLIVIKVLRYDHNS